MNEETQAALDELTPERAASVIETITKQWQKDWSIVVDGLSVAAGIPRQEAFQFMILRELAGIRDLLTEARKPVFHENCEGCRNERAFHEAQFEALRLSIRHLKEEHTDDWKDES